MFDPQSSETTGYHIFLEPELGLFNELQELIKSLAEKYNGPVFTPHVTLLARISVTNDHEAKELTKELAGKIPTFTIKLGGTNGENSYFRSLYVDLDNPEPITESHTTANEVFNLTDINEYIPHLSLYYGNINAEQREEMMNTIPNLSEKSFVVNKLHLYRTLGKVETWEKISEFSLES